MSYNQQGKRIKIDNIVLFNIRVLSRTFASKCFPPGRWWCELVLDGFRCQLWRSSKQCWRLESTKAGKSTADEQLWCTTAATTTEFVWLLLSASPADGLWLYARLAASTSNDGPRWLPSTSATTTATSICGRLGHESTIFDGCRAAAFIE